jgi:hypothetical protein
VLVKVCGYSCASYSALIHADVEAMSMAANRSARIVVAPLSRANHRARRAN